MNQADYFEAFKQECCEQTRLTAAKNKDYAGAENAFANFELIEILTGGRVTTEDGILVRMSDKLQRVANLLAREAAVKDEAVTDTLRDLSVYAKILKIRLDGKLAKAAELKDNSALPTAPHAGNEFSDRLCHCGPCERKRRQSADLKNMSAPPK